MSIEFPRQAFKIKRSDTESPVRFYANDRIFKKVLAFVGDSNLRGRKATAEFKVYGKVLAGFKSKTRKESNRDRFSGKE
jgi:hypothetical protein